jgi:hypothetical protein
VKKYLWNLLIALDQFGNAVLAGHPDETISSRAGKAVSRGDPWALFLCRMLHVLDKGHCVKAIETDEGMPFDPNAPVPPAPPPAPVQWPDA